MPILDYTNRRSAEENSKLPKPSNIGLKALFTGINKVIIKGDGVFENKAMSDKVVLTITDATNINTFGELLEIDENYSESYCVCLGTYAIELYQNENIKAIISLHHGQSIRYHYWRSDGELANKDALVEFLNDLGLSEPLQKRIEQKRHLHPDRVAERRWLEFAPKCFEKYWYAIINPDLDYLPNLINDLVIEIPNKDQRIISLLQTFGKTDNFFTSYPIYEEAPKHILKTFRLEDVFITYLRSNRNYKTRRGLGRFLCQLDNRIAQEVEIPNEILTDIEKCFTMLKNTDGINKIKILKH